MYEQKKIIMKWAFFCPTMYSQWPTNISELYVFAHTCTHNDQQQKKVKQFFAQTKRSKPRNEEQNDITTQLFNMTLTLIGHLNGEGGA